MTRPSGAGDARDPWRALVMVAQIPQTGLHRDIEADQAARAVMAQAAGLREMSAAHASFDLALTSGGRVHVTGRVQARIGQTCVVTLDPIDNEIDEPVDLIFVPAEQLPQLDHLAEDGPEGDADATDALEPIENGMIDLGRLATDMLYLAIDPYPRKAEAVFEPQVEAADPEDHPFAALKALRSDSDTPAGGKVPGKPNAKPKRS
jgi:uncharacterized metal-binding protein YceD (DUF177 family)